MITKQKETGLNAITIKSHFAFSGILIPTTIKCSINSYFTDDQLIQDIEFPDALLADPFGQTNIQCIIKTNLEYLEHNLDTLIKYPLDSDLAAETVELLIALRQLDQYLLPNNQIFDLGSYAPTIQNLINNLK